METDSFFCHLFKELPQTVFELIVCRRSKHGGISLTPWSSRRHFGSMA
jgi:hypothetical protein